MVVIFPVEYNCRDCDVGIEFLEYEISNDKYKHVVASNYAGESKESIESVKKALEDKGCKVEILVKSGNGYAALGADGTRIRMRISGISKYNSSKYLRTMRESLNSVISMLKDADCNIEYWSGLLNVDPHFGSEYITEDRKDTYEDPQATIIIDKDQLPEGI